jgi:hypothetical protein
VHRPGNKRETAGKYYTTAAFGLADINGIVITRLKKSTNWKVRNVSGYKRRANACCYSRQTNDRPKLRKCRETTSKTNIISLQAM